MALVEISQDDLDCAKVLGPNPKPTGRLRWWHGIDREPVLQAEWREEYSPMTIWVDVPIHKEVEG